MMIRMRAGLPENRCLVLGEDGSISLSHYIRTGSVAHPSILLFKVILAPIPGGLSGRDLKLTAHPMQCRRLRKSADIFPLLHTSSLRGT
jgi:hypothetical protein